MQLLRRSPWPRGVALKLRGQGVQSTLSRVRASCPPPTSGPSAAGETSVNPVSGRVAGYDHRTLIAAHNCTQADVTVASIRVEGVLLEVVAPV